MMEGPVILADMQLSFTKGQIRDLDIIGREHAEKSNDIKIAFNKGWIAELSKDPSPVSEDVQASIRVAAENIAGRAEEAIAANADVISRLEEQNKKLVSQLEKQSFQEVKQAEILDKTTRILSEIKSFADRDPILLRTLKEALGNISAERRHIKEQSDEIKSSGDSDAEIEAHERILRLKDNKLKKNFEDIGKSISKDADSVEDTLSQMDELGI
jgi:hypothetical protein